MTVKMKKTQKQKTWKPTLCEHRLEPGSGREQADYDYDMDNPRIVFDVTCSKCGLSGSVIVRGDDVRW
jgi:hypothetical protein